MKTQHTNNESEFLFERALSSGFSTLPEVEFTENDDNNMVKMILNQVNPKPIADKGFVEKMLERISDFVSSSKLFTYGTPAFNTAIVLIVAVTMSTVVFQDYWQSPEVYMNYDANTVETTENNLPTVIAIPPSSTEKVEKPLQKEYKSSQKSIGSLLLATNTRSVDDLLSEEIADSLNYFRSLKTVNDILISNKISIELNTYSKIETEWIYSEYQGKLYKHQLIINGDANEYSNLDFILKSQQIDKTVIDIKLLRNDINFNEIIEDIKRTYFGLKK